LSWLKPVILAARNRKRNIFFMVLDLCLWSKNNIFNGYTQVI
jgi:hypothetical protein